MSKTENKLVNGVSCVLAAIQRASVLSAALDVAKFRDTFKLTSMGKKRIASAIDDLLTTELIVNQFGPWVLAEIEHPNYQLSAATGNTVVLFHKEGAPNPGADVVAGYGTKPAGDDEDDSEIDDDPDNKKPAAFDAMNADAIDDKERAAWDAFMALVAQEYKDAFTWAQLEFLWSKGVFYDDASTALSIPYLRVMVANHDRESSQAIKDAESDYYASIQSEFKADDWEWLLREGLVGENADSPALAVEKLRDALERKAPKTKVKKAKAGKASVKEALASNAKRKAAPKAKKAPAKKAGK